MVNTRETHFRGNILKFLNVLKFRGKFPAISLMIINLERMRSLLLPEDYISGASGRHGNEQNYYN